MAKAEEFVSPANLWGKPLPTTTSKAPVKKEKKEKGTTGMRFATPEDYDDEEVDVDVDAELEEDVVDDEAAYAEAETDYADEDSEDVRETAAKLTAEEVAAIDEEDEDETEYAPEEGDDVSDDTVDSAVEADKDGDPVKATKPAKTTKGKVKDMAEKKSGADHIREEIARRQESGDSLRGVDIVAALAKKRVTVSPAQVSQLLKKAGVAAGKRSAPAEVTAGSGDERSRDAARRKHANTEPAKVAPKRPVAKGPTGSTTLPMTRLKAATSFLAACDGCYDTAEEILAEHKQLRSMMSS
jgi:hypothetical protein